MILKRINNRGAVELDYVLTDCSMCKKSKKLLWECTDDVNRENNGALFCQECVDIMKSN